MRPRSLGPRRKRGSRALVRGGALPMQRCRCLRLTCARAARRSGEGDHAVGLALTMQIVALRKRARRRVRRSGAAKAIMRPAPARRGRRDPIVAKARASFPPVRARMRSSAWRVDGDGRIAGQWCSLAVDHRVALLLLRAGGMAPQRYRSGAGAIGHCSWRYPMSQNIHS